MRPLPYLNEVERMCYAGVRLPFEIALSEELRLVVNRKQRNEITFDVASEMIGGIGRLICKVGISDFKDNRSSEQLKTTWANACEMVGYDGTQILKEIQEMEAGKTATRD